MCPQYRESSARGVTSQRFGLLSWLHMNRRQNDLITAAFFLLPSLLIFGVFTYSAMGFNAYLSFTNSNFFDQTFVGLMNYQKLLTDRRFWIAARNTLYYTFGRVSLCMVLGLILAVVLNQKLKGRGLYRALIFSPYVTSTAATSLLWAWVFEPTHGVLNFILSCLGIHGPRWLTSTTWALPAIIIMDVWRLVGYTMTIFLAGLQNIPRELYDAAKVDGAGPWDCFWKITLPLLSPTTFFLIVTGFTGSFLLFDAVAIMTQGGPVNATLVFNYYIYTQAFQMIKAGYASSISVVVFLLIMGLTLFQIIMSRRWVYYQ